MQKSKTTKALMRSLLMASTAVAGFALTAGASQAADPIIIGLTSDASGQYANSGASDRRGMLMAIEEFNAKGGVLGRQIETIHIDTETTPATGSRVAERMITRDNVGFLVGAVSSGVANAISQVAQKYGVIYLNTNSSSPTESGENCHRVKFVWDGNGANFAKAAIKNSIDAYGTKWMQITNDYGWGHDTSAATKELIDQYGGEVVENVLVPQGTRDFTAALLTVQQVDPQAIAAAVGGDDLKALRSQVAELGMGEKYAWINNQQDWPDVYGLPKDNLFGVFGTTWYYTLDLPGVDEFVAKYREMYPDTQMEVPGNVFYNGYWATRSLLEAIEAAGTTNNHEVIKQLEQLRIPAEVRMQHDDAYMNPNTHQLQQTIYLAKANTESDDTNDMFTIVSNSSPDTIADDAADAACQLESFEDTPVYEP